MDITDNSKNVRFGSTFIALENGCKYIPEAIENGATKIITKKGKYSVNTKHVRNPRNYLIKYLKKNYYDSIKDIKLIGITGTNGKTTTSYLIYQALNMLGEKCAYIGTIGFYIDGKVKDLNNTTPDLIDLYELILEAKSKGCKYVVMEVSSHSLSLKRVNALKFDYMMFTNLTQDHLNYHKTMKKYFKAKKKLLKLRKKDSKVFVNNDDSYMKKIKKSIKIGECGDYKISDIKYDNGMNFTLNETEYKCSLIGNYNAYNMSFVIALLKELGYKKINKIIKKLEAPSGRMEFINKNNKTVIVDYAHTPDAVSKTISTIREFSTGKLYVVIGCGGNRDKTKRPEMASISTCLADYSIFTSDNPRFEDPLEIINDMTENLCKTNYEVIINREDAIKKGIQLLENNDILMVLGKGHEKYQIIENEKIYFDDIEIALNNM